MPELICRLHFERVSPHIYCSLSHIVVAWRVLIPFPVMGNRYARCISYKIIIFTCIHML